MAAKNNSPKPHSERKKRLPNEVESGGILGGLLLQLSVLKQLLWPSSELEQEGIGFFGRALRLFLILSVLVGIGTGIYLVVQPKNDAEAKRLALAKRIAGSLDDISYDEVIRSDDPGVMLQFANSLNDEFAKADLPEQLTRLKRQLELVKRINAQPSVADDIRNEAIFVRINALAIYSTFNRMHNLGEENIDQRLRECSEQNIDSADPRVALQARLALTFTYCREFEADQTDTKFDQFKTHILDSAHVFHDNPAFTDRLVAAAKLIRIADNLEKTVETYNALGETIKLSDDDAVWMIGARLQDEILFSGTDFGRLEAQLLVNDPEAIEQAKAMTKALLNAKTMSPYAVRRCIRLSEGLERLDQSVDLQMVARQLQTKRWSNTRASEMGEKLISDLETRITLLGKPIEFVGLDEDGEPIEFGDAANATFVLFVSFNDAGVGDAMGQLANLRYLRSRKVRLVCCEAIPKFDINTRTLVSGAFQPYEETLEGVFLLPFDTSTKFREQCPVISTPYGLLLDENNRVIAANFELDRTRGLIEEHLKTLDNRNN